MVGMLDGGSLIVEIEPANGYAESRIWLAQNYETMHPPRSMWHALVRSRPD